MERKIWILKSFNAVLFKNFKDIGITLLKLSHSILHEFNSKNFP
jgi:hypothetical protein